MSSSVATRSRESVSRTLAEQLEPLVRLHAEIRSTWPVTLDLDRAQARLAGQRPAFDARAVLRDAGDLSAPFARALTALELSGLASSESVQSVRDREPDATALALAWLGGERVSYDPAKRLASRAGGVVGNAVLRRAADQVLEAARVDNWARATCPCCGGGPDLALTHVGRRRIVCSRCDTRWRTTTTGCLNCGAEHEPTVVRIRSAYLGYTLVVCNACGSYLKERAANGSCEPLIERVLTADLDAAAQRRGLRA